MIQDYLKAGYPAFFVLPQENHYERKSILSLKAGSLLYGIV
jgi:hypothetical protein